MAPREGVEQRMAEMLALELDTQQLLTALSTQPMHPREVTDSNFRIKANLAALARKIGVLEKANTDLT